MKTKISLIIAVVIVLSCAGSAWADTITVGLEPGYDFNNIQAGIDAASDGDTILVADGTYTGDGNRDIDFLGKDISVQSENGPDECIIDCNGTAEQPHRAFNLEPGNNSRIVGFTIINGYADEGGAICCWYDASPAIINCILKDNAAMYSGGAIYCLHGNPRIINCTINDNSVERHYFRGGGISSEMSNINIINSRIIQNTADNGGGIYSMVSNINIINSRIIQNTANKGGGIYSDDSNINIINSRLIQNTATEGGGIYCQYHSSVTIKACTINNNLAEAEYGGYGGGIFCDEYNDVTIIDSAICNNIVKGGISVGGGLCFYSLCETSKLIMSNCIINGNSVEGGGGSWGGGIFYGIYPFYSPALFTIINCTINGNSAKIGHNKYSFGGGICGYGSPIIRNCRISGNMASQGGGISCEQGKPVITGCIISGNYPIDRDKFGGGGISCLSGSIAISSCTIIGNSFCGVRCGWNAEAAVTSSILFYNGNGKGDLYQIDRATVTYSDVQMHRPDGEPWEGIGNINKDPCFVDAGYWDVNGVWVEGDYHLLCNSPCIDAANDANVYTDIEGNIRPFDFPGVDNNGELPEFDMGAYEAQLDDPIELLDILAQDVIDLELQHGIENSLLAKLDTAIEKLEDENENNDVVAVNSLQAFINAVQAQRCKKIPEDADKLIAAAQEIINLLSKE